MTETQIAEKIAGSEYVFAILFIIGLIVVGRWFFRYFAEMKAEMKQVNIETKEEMKKVYDESKEDLKKANEEREQELKDYCAELKTDAKHREAALMEHLQRSNDSQEKTADTLVKIESSLHSLENKMDSGFNDVWEHLNQIDKMKSSKK